MNECFGLMHRLLNIFRIKTENGLFMKLLHNSIYSYPFILYENPCIMIEHDLFVCLDFNLVFKKCFEKQNNTHLIVYKN